jgi:hypothetical protein
MDGFDGLADQTQDSIVSNLLAHSFDFTISSNQIIYRKRCCLSAKRGEKQQRVLVVSIILQHYRELRKMFWVLSGS